MKVLNKSIFGFLGPNGAGKTTSLKMLTCLIKPTQGTAKVHGYDIEKNPNEVRDHIGMLPQQVSLYKDLTVEENAELCADFYGVSKNIKHDRIEELMELIDIKYARNKLISQLSGGQKQKASLVASLVHKPDILFLDEPTIGLDPTTKRILWDLIEELNQDGRTIILCSHDMYEVDLLCDHVGIINHGLLSAFDTPQALKDIILEKQTNTQQHKFNEILNNTIQNTQTTENEKQILQNQLQNTQNKNTYQRKMTMIIENLNPEIQKTLENHPLIYDIQISKNNRLTLKIDGLNKDLVNQIINTIHTQNGKILSITTQEPSLEDVFVNFTQDKVDDDVRA